MKTQHDADAMFLLYLPNVCFPLPLPQPVAKFANFRQRRAKSESSGTQKKTAKRKGKTVQTNDGSTEERHLEEPDTDLNHGDIDKGHLEVCPFYLENAFLNS